MTFPLLLAASLLATGEAPDEADEKTDSAACLKQALDQTLLSDHEAVLLCEFAQSPEPVRCYRELRQETFLEEEDILRACRAAVVVPAQGSP